MDGACRAERIWLTGSPECSEKIREMGFAGSIYPAVCRSDGMRLALSMEAYEFADLEVRSVAAANLVGCASWSMGTYIDHTVMNFADLCKKLR